MQSAIIAQEPRRHLSFSCDVPSSSSLGLYFVVKFVEASAKLLLSSGLASFGNLAENMPPCIKTCVCAMPAAFEADLGTLAGIATLKLLILHLDSVEAVDSLCRQHTLQMYIWLEFLISSKLTQAPCCQAAH